MESSHQASKIMGRLLLGLTFVLLGYAALSHYSSPIVRRLAARSDREIQLFIGTQPAMVVSYNPSTRKAHLTVQEQQPCNATKKRCPSANQPNRFFIPAQTNRELFWEHFKQNLISWRYNPLLAGQTGWNYLTAWHEKRTNLSPAEFILLALEMTQLEPSDFTIKLPPVSKKRGARKATPPAAEPEQPQKTSLSQQDRPLILEIFNASGKRGVALELTQYLRNQNEKGLLRVDVFNYENYPSIEETSWLEDYSGRLMDVKQLSHSLGINSEIRTGTTPNVMCDTRIIVGKDFKMPL